MATLLMLQFSALWRSKLFRHIVIHYSLAVIAALSTLHFIFDVDNNLFSNILNFDLRGFNIKSYIPFVWPDYIGYLIGWWWIAARLAHPKTPLWLFALQTIIALLCLTASSNRIAILLVGTGIIGSISITSIRHFFPYLFCYNNNAIWRRLTIITLLTPLFWLMACAWDGFHVNYSKDAEQSIPTRVLLNHIALTAITDEPSRLVFGKGWGQFEDDFFKHALIRDIRIYQDGRHVPNWPLVRGHNYHTHNMATEILLSLGLVGFLIWMTMPMLIVARLNNTYFWNVIPVFIGITLLQHFWFAMPQTMPLQALCWFLLMRNTPSTNTAFTRIKSSHAIIAAVILIAAFSWGEKAQYDTARYTQIATDPFARGAIVDESFLEDDIARGGDHLRSIVIRFTQRLALQPQNVEKKHIELLSRMIQATKAMADNPRVGAYNAATIHYIYNVALSSLRAPIFRPILNDAIENYPHYALLHSKRAPYREDIIAPYLFALETNKSPTIQHQLLGFTQELLAVANAHRSAIWLSGKVLSTEDASRDEGIIIMKDALKMGVDKVYPINEDEIKLLQQTP
jgi:hypothetical protein